MWILILLGILNPPLGFVMLITAIVADARLKRTCRRIEQGTTTPAAASEAAVNAIGLFLLLTFMSGFGFLIYCAFQH